MWTPAVRCWTEARDAQWLSSQPCMHIPPCVRSDMTTLVEQIQQLLALPATEVQLRRHAKERVALLMAESCLEEV